MKLQPFDLRGAVLEHIEPHSSGGYILHLRDSAGRWHIFYARRKMDTIKSFLVYGLALAVVVAAVILAVTV